MHRANPPPTSENDATQQEGGAAPVESAVDPVEEETPPPPSSGLLGMEHVVDHFLSTFPSTTLPPRSASPGYIVGAFLVLVAMGAIVIAYLATIYLLGYGLYRYSLVFPEVSKLGFGLLVYAPFAIVPVLIAFLIRPIFSRERAYGPPKQISPAEEPRLFELVEKLSALVAAPMPDRILLDNSVNAAASVRGVVFPKYTLSLGLPLVSGLTVAELSGVIGHELGHFQQRFAGLLESRIRSLDHWFERAVYSRDNWEVALQRLAQGRNPFGSWQIRILLWFCRIFIVAVRWILFGYMLFARLFDSILLHQKEFDSDRVETTLSGKDGFIRAFRSIERLTLAEQAAQDSLAMSLRHGVRCDNYVKLIQAHVDRFDEAAVEKARRNMDAQCSSMLSSHPPPSERIRVAEERNEAPLLVCDAPATTLFSDFERLAGGMTAETFASVSGSLEKRSAVELVRETEQRANELQAFARVFQNRINAHRLILTDGALDVTLPATKQATINTLLNLRHELASTRDAYMESIGHLILAKHRTYRTSTAVEYARASVRFQAEDFNVSGNILVDVLQDERQALRWEQTLERSLEVLEHPVQRYVLVLLYLIEKFGHEIPELNLLESDRVEVRNALLLLRELRKVEGAIGNLRACRIRMTLVAHAYSRTKKRKDYVGVLNGTKQELIRAISDLLGMTTRSINHISIREEREHIADVLFAGQVPKHDIGEILEAAFTIREELSTLYCRAFAKVAIAAVKVEDALGLEPLPPITDADAAILFKTEQWI
ncbi:MAG: M48 family metalloprotease [Deltaproteobacteria bacterium]|nr:M48 family metalloprotease [Deltaproteobacteria bacterium]